MSDILKNIQVIDLGARKKKHFKNMAKGRGRLLDAHDDAINRVVSQLPREGENVIILPVMVVYKKKPKKRKLLGLGRAGW